MPTTVQDIADELARRYSELTGEQAVQVVVGWLTDHNLTSGLDLEVPSYYRAAILEDVRDHYEN